MTFKVVGLAMNSVQYFNEEHGYPREAAIPDEKMLAEGKCMTFKISCAIFFPSANIFSSGIAASRG
jgi:protein involved in sex pheromone biosynthesis